MRTSLAAVLLLTACSCSHERAIPRDQIVTYLTDAVVRVEVGGGSGSGFFIDPHLVGTAKHVVEGEELASIEVVTSAGDRCETERVIEHESADVALLRVSCVGPSALAGYADAQLGERVLASGWPQGASFTASGDVARVDDDSITFTAPVTFGMSGGPVVARESGRLVAIVTGFRSPLPLWSGESVGAPSEALRELHAAERAPAPQRRR